MPISKYLNGQLVEMTPEQEAEITAKHQSWVANEKPVIERRQQFEAAKRAALSFDEEEVDILLAGYLEVKLVRLAVLLGQTPANVDTPVIDAINAVFPGQTKLQIAQTIENRAQNYLTAASTALANKIKAGG